ncbi:MAG: ABC transporter permease subunit [Gemmataceae bacterium]
MAQLADPARQGSLLHYRAWQSSLVDSDTRGTLLFLALQAGLLLIMAIPVVPAALRLLAVTGFLAAWGLVVYSRAWPIARVALVMLLRRKLFWAIYALALMIFFMFFFGQYLMSWALTQLGEQDVRVGGLGRANPSVLVNFLRDQLKMNGSAEMYRNFFWLEGYSVMIVLALAGALVIGNDLRFGSLSFYLARPISRWHYLLGKGLAVALFINLITTVPAILLFVQFGLLESWSYFFDSVHLLVGIVGYGMLLTVTLTTILLATATWLRRTVPLIMTWTTLFFFCRLLAAGLVDNLQLDPRWRLIDLWNNNYLLGSVFLGIPYASIRPTPQPEWYEAAGVLGGLCLLCLVYLVQRIRGVEIVT